MLIESKLHPLARSHETFMKVTRLKDLVDSCFLIFFYILSYFYILFHERCCGVSETSNKFDIVELKFVSEI